MGSERTVIKKIAFTAEEWKEFERAMKEEGLEKPHDYVVNMVQTRRQRHDAEIRRWRSLKYRHSDLYTIYNEIVVGINSAQNIERFVTEAGKLCQELR